MAMFEFRSASAAACTAVNGGATTISTSVTSLRTLRSSLVKTVVSWTVLNIFQLPAIRGVRMVFSRPQGLHSRRASRRPHDESFIRQRRDAGERPAAEKLERGAAAG